MAELARDVPVEINIEKFYKVTFYHKVNGSTYSEWDIGKTISEALGNASKRAVNCWGKEATKKALRTILNPERDKELFEWVDSL